MNAKPDTFTAEGESATATKLGCVVIGKNEGDRLIRCLKSLSKQGIQIVYVDSASTDGSVEAAKAAGADVVELDLSIPFSAARARNEGVAKLKERGAPDYVQFVDGDCEMHPDWMVTASQFLDDHPEVAAVAGRLRERFPEASIYNRLCDAEWARPPGEIKAIGGIAMMRTTAFDEADGFRADIAAGEEPELCVRFRQRGWTIWSLENDMAFHDAAMTRFSQWWKRARRGGHASAEGKSIHGAPPERMNVDRVRRALVWGAGIPFAILIAAIVISPWALLGLLVYPLQVLRLAKREGFSRGSLERGTFLTIGKFAETLGIFDFHRRRLKKAGGLYEYSKS